MNTNKSDSHESLEQKSKKHLLDFFTSFDPHGEFLEWRNKIMVEFRILRSKKYPQGSQPQTQPVQGERVEQNSHSLDWSELDRR
ncbi:MAG: hypothetical protein EXS12_08540 [Phycisphaerales bacterium]|nr:hypothetical protein [Phycisphaerales bacterium]